jgi:hypothetical protein
MQAALARGRPKGGRCAHMAVSPHVVDDTVPARPAFALLHDPEFLHLRALVDEHAAKLHGQGWDNLAHVAAFAKAIAVVKESVLARCANAIDRRLVVELLFPLLPAHARAREFHALPDAIAIRAADGFVLGAADLPAFSPALSAHLADPELLTRALVPGSVWLAPRGVCPAAARGAAFLARIQTLRGPVARCLALAADGSDATYDVRTAADGKPFLVDGSSQPIDVPLESLSSWLLGAGPDARGLDLRKVDDRCLLLVFAHLLRERGLFDPLAHAAGYDGALVTACVHAAADAVATFTLDPMSSRIALRKHNNDNGWPETAWELLATTGCVRDALPRAPRTEFARDVVWADSILAPGFVEGRVTATAAGRLFARLCTSLLAPLGALPSSGMKDGSGDVLVQMIAPDGFVTRLVASFSGSFSGRVQPLARAWTDGAAHALAEPRGAPQHELKAMPAWIAFFLEAIAGDDGAAP